MRLWPTRVVLIGAAVYWASFAGAQSQLASADAANFMGSWTLELHGPAGVLPLNLTITDQDGKVAGELKAQLLRPVAAAVKDITKSGDDLVVKYTGDAQGVSIPVALILSPDGDRLKIRCEIAHGQFSMDGVGIKK
jgi:hypothetical protein